MPCPVHFEALRIEDLPELNREGTLYTFDPRSILDECLGKHRYIVSCENLPFQMLQGQHVAVNQYASKLPRPHRNKAFVVPITGDPRPSMYNRMATLDIPVGIDGLYVCVPHPEADQLAADLNLRLNHPYSDFVRYNDKIVQKTLLGDLTPEWSRIDPKNHPFNEDSACYYKRALGAGGYATFHHSDRSGMKLPSRKYPAEWYREVEVVGEPRSVQVYRSQDGSCTVFGYSEMRILDRKTYAGGLMRRVTVLDKDKRAFIREALHRLNPMLEGYQGFLGLDFMETEREIHVLEANVRVTMATFATLDLNAGNQDQQPFYRFR
jgi:hypothetical protein